MEDIDIILPTVANNKINIISSTAPAIPKRSKREFRAGASNFIIAQTVIDLTDNRRNRNSSGFTMQTSIQTGKSHITYR